MRWRVPLLLLLPDDARGRWGVGLVSNLSAFLLGAATMGIVIMWCLFMGYVVVRAVKRERAKD